MLFKYLSVKGAKCSLSNPEYISLKFSYPTDYNDPHELFLMANQPGDLTEAAFYENVLGELANFPVTCFSRRPESAVMWAHYAENQSGVCLAIDEDELGENFDNARVGDVEYADSPSDDHVGMVTHAFYTGKGRHLQWALNAAYKAAYFTKRIEWQHEQERRLIVDIKDVIQVEGHLVARIAPTALEAIIVGKHTDHELRGQCVDLARALGVPALEIQFGKRSVKPYFVDLIDGHVFVWEENSFESSEWTCLQCGEPRSDYNCDDDCELCAWCQIDDSHREQASGVNLLQAVWRLGIEDPGIDFPGTSFYGKLENDKS